VSQRQTVAYGVVECLVKLTPGVLARPELFVGLGGVSSVSLLCWG